MKKGVELFRGKTKAGFATEDPSSVILKSFNAITKNDDPSATKQMEKKAVYATQTTCNVFRLLQAAGIPVAFKEQLSDTEFLAEKCVMIPLEVVARRYETGSYLKRFPNREVEAGSVPHRAHSLIFELFLKTTGNVVKSFDGVTLCNTPGVEDPFIKRDALDISWSLHHPKLPAWGKESALGVSVRSEDILPKIPNVLDDIEMITRKTFLVLEGAWAQLGFRLIDFKIEFGVTTDGRLVVADVIDNDSWRLRTADWMEVSKQCFRDNASMEEISNKYAMVAKLTDSFHIPKQGIVVWRGSANDLALTANGKCGAAGVVRFCDLVVSGHKSPSVCLAVLEDTLSKLPEGGVIIAMVGMSNGLGPILAARTSWPVIAVPLTAKENPNDVWSSLNVPSQVPLLTVVSQKNAVLAALNILAQKNPYAYMIRQYEIEKLDV